MAHNISGITQIGANQQTGGADDSNDADSEIGHYVSGVTALLMTDTDAVTITDADPDYDWTRAQLFRITNGSPAPDAAGTITVPATARPFVLFENETGFEQTITISGQSQTPDSVPAGGIRAFSSDGSNIRAIDLQSDILRDFVTTADALIVNEVVMSFLMPRDVLFPVDFDESLGRLIDGPVGGAIDFDIQVDGSSIATMSFADVGTSGVAQSATFSGQTAAELVSAGSRVEIVAPSNLQSADKLSIALIGVLA